MAKSENCEIWTSTTDSSDCTILPDYEGDVPILQFFRFYDSSDFKILQDCHESDNIITVHKNHEFTSFFHPLQKIEES